MEKITVELTFRCEICEAVSVVDESIKIMGKSNTTIMSSKHLTMIQELLENMKRAIQIDWDKVE